MRIFAGSRRSENPPCAPLEERTMHFLASRVRIKAAKGAGRSHSSAIWLAVAPSGWRARKIAARIACLQAAEQSTALTGRWAIRVILNCSPYRQQEETPFFGEAQLRFYVGPFFRDAGKDHARVPARTSGSPLARRCESAVSRKPTRVAKRCCTRGDKRRSCMRWSEPADAALVNQPTVARRSRL